MLAKNIPLLKSLRKAWSAAITKAARHAETCRRCYRRNLDEKTARETGVLAVFDPCTPCPKAGELWAAERSAAQAFRNAGGRLPAGVDWGA